MTEQDKRIISEYAVKLNEGVLGCDEFNSLNSMLASDRKVARYYTEVMHSLGTIVEFSSEILCQDKHTLYFSAENEENAGVFKEEFTGNTSLKGVDLEVVMSDGDLYSGDHSDLTGVMLELLEMERTSPAVEFERPAPVKPKRELIQKVERDFKWFPGEGNRNLIFAYLALAACIMLFAGYVYFFVPDPVALPIVANLADSVGAEWGDETSRPDENGDMIQSRYYLKQGYASILFNDGATVTVEGPADLALKGDGKMELFLGKIYAVVPERAQGFIVNAGDTKILDLGTEFGVEVDSSNNAQLHVTKGRTILFPDQPNRKSSSINVDAGEAKKVYNDGFVKDIPIKEYKFVRRIDSKLGVVESWPASRISYIPISSDQDTGISQKKTYTHALDFGRRTATINNVVFEGIGQGGEFPKFNSSSIDGTGSSSMHTVERDLAGLDKIDISGNIKHLLEDAMYGDVNSVITLTGLTPGRRYQLRLYQRHFVTYEEDRYQKIGFDTDGVGSDIKGSEDIAFFNEDNATEPEPNFENPDQTYALVYDYALSPGVTKLTIYIKSEVKPYYLYGLTNEEISYPADHSVDDKSWRK